ncbi:hypothetical protein T4D_2100 [Trichinella pseudospiralis]|uniref:Uncharacterized protein n=1 Tax=Trichinella pseudospiralis TaxID=6337 RepID=A0A0V1FWH2_TRIPS|nr:hypothetical protein T4D_2100 [Trichinella pseudospiralis]
MIQGKGRETKNNYLIKQCARIAGSHKGYAKFHKIHRKLRSSCGMNGIQNWRIASLITLQSCKSGTLLQRNNSRQISRYPPLWVFDIYRAERPAYCMQAPFQSDNFE